MNSAMKLLGPSRATNICDGVHCKLSLRKHLNAGVCVQARAAGRRAQGCGDECAAEYYATQACRIATSCACATVPGCKDNVTDSTRTLAASQAPQPLLHHPCRHRFDADDRHQLATSGRAGAPRHRTSRAAPLTFHDGQGTMLLIPMPLPLATAIRLWLLMPALPTLEVTARP